MMSVSFGIADSVDEAAVPVDTDSIAAKPSSDAITTFEGRRKWVLDSTCANPYAYCSKDQPFFAAEACFFAGQDDLGRDLAKKGYLLWCAHDPKKIRATDFFRLWPAMDCYVRWKQKLDDGTKAQFKALMTNITCYSYTYTPNLSLLMWTTRYLGGQEWGDSAFVPTPRDSSSHYKSNPDISSRQHLLDVMAETARTGGEEYASRPYGAANIGPFYSLAELAQEADVKQCARITSESLLARYAPIWLRGSMIITSRRSYPDTFNDPMGVATWFWVFFGGDLIPPANSHMLDAAVLGTPPPPLIAFAAAERSKLYEVLNRFQPSSNGLQQSWVTRDYGLFSEAFQNNPHILGQTYPFGVRWIQPGAADYTLFWFSVPLLDQLEVPGRIRGSHPHGFDPRAQYTFQHEGSLLYVCDTDKDKARFPYGLGFVPGSQLALIDESGSSGRVFLYYPGVLIAFSASKPFEWDRLAPLKMPNAEPIKGDSEFRVPGPAFAAAIETASPGEFPGKTADECLRSFRDAIVSKTKLELLGGDHLAASYLDRDGTTITRVFAGEASINGVRVDLDKWPIADSPFVHQLTDASPLVITDGKTQRLYDFDHWTIEEGPASP